jgi:proteasome maturation protein
MRIAPAPSHPTTHTHLPTASHLPKFGAPSAPGLHDTLRAGLNPAYALSNNSSSSTPSEPQLQSAHPLEARLARWEATQENLKMEGLRRTFGISEPVRRGMELKIVRDSEWRPAVLGGQARARGVHEDILLGKDTEIQWEDVFAGKLLQEGEEYVRDGSLTRWQVMRQGRFRISTRRWKRGCG